MIVVEDLKAMCPQTSIGVLQQFVDPLNATFAEFNIDNPLRECFFLAQVAHESGGFNYVHEIASGAAYDSREDLGNTSTEAISAAGAAGTTPGRFYRGHGLIQITGYFNHAACGTALGIDAVNHPELLTLSPNHTRSAGWFWDANKLNDIADRNDFKLCTRRINGGYNGYDDRLRYLARIQARIGG